MAVKPHTEGQEVLNMYPSIPFTTVRDRAIDLNTIRYLAAQRDLPPSLEQRRDSQGQFVSHRDLPGKKAQDQ